MTTIIITQGARGSVTNVRGPQGQVLIGAARRVEIREAARGAVLIERMGVQGTPGPQSAPQRIDFPSAATWIFEHSLGRVPMVDVYLAGGERVITDVNATDFNVSVIHAQPQAGFALLN